MPCRRMTAGCLALLAGTTIAVSPLAAQADSLVLPPKLQPVQVPDTLVPLPELRRASPIRLWQLAAVGGGIALSTLLDETLRNSAQRNRTVGTNNAAGVFRHMGQPEVYGTIALGTVGLGLLTKKPALTRAGLRISSSLLLAGGLALGGKMAFGRERPFQNPDREYIFSPFRGRDASFPSGHTTMAFALATSLSNEIHKPLVSVLLYTAAAGTGWSRINDDQHWLSDVVAGAALGVASAQFMDGKWRLFNLKPPSMLATPTGGLGIGWHATF